MNAERDVDNCLSVLELDVLLAGSDDDGLKRRLAACAHCQRRLADLDAGRAAAMTPAHVAAQRDAIWGRLAPARSRRRAAVRFAAPVLALAAAALVVATWPRSQQRASHPAPAGDEIRWKGGDRRSPIAGGGDPGGSAGGAGGSAARGIDRFDVLQVAPVPARVVGDGEPVAPGATLSFRAACARGCSVTLFVVDGDGVRLLADRVAPPWPVAPGAVAQLPVSVDVDAAPGDDRIVAWLCAEPVDAAALRAALAGPAPAGVSGCEVRDHRIPRRGRTQ